jgi:hypothetical protein
VLPVHVLKLAVFAVALLTVPDSATVAQNEVTVDQIIGNPSKGQPELGPGIVVSGPALPKIGKPINCTGASKAKKPECFTATLQGRRR